MRAISPFSRVSTPDLKLNPLKLSRPFLHPTVSRLRSFTPQSSRATSNEDSVVSHSRLFNGASPPPSHFSSISRQSSVSNLQASSIKQNGGTQDKPDNAHEVFKWTDLHSITQQVFSKASQKASSMLGAPILGSPTVLAANGLICVGTTEGKVVVYDFNQTLLCVCESNLTGPPHTYYSYTSIHIYVRKHHRSSNCPRSLS